MRILFVLWGVLHTCFSFSHGISEEDKSSMISGGYFEYMKLGASHMLTGYDHLLFIFGVIFFLYKFMDVVKFITVFTIGHSITLVFATLMGVTANYFIVDAIIALTVVYKGFDNLDGFRKYLKISPPSLLLLVFIFGLIHGFGLSTRLQQLPLGDHGLVLRILSFNIGVEVGQIAALTLMLVVLAGWRKTSLFKKFSRIANIGLMVAGFYLFAMQIDGYLHSHEHHAEETHQTHEGDHSHDEDHHHDDHHHSHDDDHGHSH